MSKARSSSRETMDLKQKRISNFFATKPASKSLNLPSADANTVPATPKPMQHTRTPSNVASNCDNTVSDKLKSPGILRRSPRRNNQEQQQAAQAPQGPGMAIVGRRISVHWPLDKAWYSGLVEDYDPNNNKHRVHYEDGEVEWLDLNKEEHKLLEAPAANGKQTTPAQPKKTSPPAKTASKPNTGGTANTCKPSTGGTANYGKRSTTGAANSGKRRLQQAAGTTAVDIERAAELELELMDDIEDDIEDVEDDMDEDFDVEKEMEKEVEEEDVDLVDEEDEDDVPIKRLKQGARNARSSGGKRAALATPPSPQPKKRRTEDEPPADMEMAHVTPPTTAAKVAVPISINRSISQQQRNQLRLKLDPMPDATTADGSAAIVTGVTSNVTSDGERFTAKLAARFPFLHPDKIKDANGRRPDHPDYNPRTLSIPRNDEVWRNISPGQKQWWEFKSQNFDSVLLFKVGKFYEMFEMDAYVGVDVLGLQFMSGDKPHAGFPEMAYSQMAESLARAGYRVVVVEQTETPQQLAAANQQAKKAKPSSKNRTVVNRDKVAVLSKGTLMDAEMVASHPEASYAIAIWEQSVETDGAMDTVNIGLCAVDVAAGQLLLGGWTDDEMRGGLRTHLASLQPLEVILPKEGLSTTSMRVLKASLMSPQMNHLRGPEGEWSLEQVEEILNEERYFKSNADMMPEVLQTLLDTGSEAAVTAFCGMLKFLRDAILDKVVMPLGRISLLPDTTTCQSVTAQGSKFEFPPNMRLNAPALENLEVLQNTEGGMQGTLMQIVDHCKTPFGRRKLKHWLTRPLARVRDIKARQAAVNALIDAPDEVSACRKELNGVSDVERAVARLQAKAVCGGVGREAPNVVLYEDVAKKNVIALRGAIMDLKAISAAIEALQQGELRQSDVLAQLLDAQFWDAMREKLQSMHDAADWNEAANTGRVLPKREPGTTYDDACKQLEQVDRQLKDFLTDVQNVTRCRTAKYVTVNKEEQIEIPDNVGVPRDFTLASQKKGFKRYITDELRELCQERQKCKETVEDALGNALSDLVKKFADSNEVWVDAVDRVANIDALLSLASAAVNGDGDMCCPEVVDPQDAPQGPFFSAKDLRHPASIAARGGAFVPNDVELGGDAANMLLLTGPNMGGKSTLLRQVCCAVVLAQIGAWVPARSMRFTPVDAIFVRMGARDHIMAGLSTFFVELLETGQMLQHATEHSLVALDELGRGTATSDGAAIAGAVLEHLTKTRKCRGMFATHYHYLSKDFSHDDAVYVAHMGCAVHPGKNGHLPELTFLYKLTAGACPKSYGTNVAQLAGLPESVLLRAASMSATYEERDTEQEQFMALLKEAARIVQGK